MKRYWVLFLALLLYADAPWTTDVQVSQDPGAGSQNETTMGIFNDTLICGGWNDSRSGPWRVGFAASYDGGVTWQETLMHEPSYPNDADPCIVVNDSGHVCYVWLSYHPSQNVGDVFITKSRDWGMSWGPSVNITSGTPNSLDDKPWAAVDANNVFVTYKDFYSANALMFRRSVDWGDTWSPARIIGYNGNGSMPFRGTDSTVYVGWGMQHVRLNKSTDMGFTWGSERIIISVTWDPPSTSYRINNIPSFGSSRDRTVLYVVFADSRAGADQLDVFFSRSTDEGENWSTPVQINDTPSSDTTLQFYPWMAVGPDDVIHVVWHDSREGTHDDLAQYYAYSEDGGVTWSTNQRVSDTVAHVGGFIGDYTASAADSHYAYALWCDTRNGATNPDIFFSKRWLAPTIPQSPYVLAKKVGDDVQLTWGSVTYDTVGNETSIDHYAVFRDTSSSFDVTIADSIGFTIPPDTDFIDSGALTASEDYYYLIKAVGTGGLESNKSNMAYAFCKTVNENPGATDKNWTSLPWHSNYSTISDLTDDLSPSGDPLIKVTNLRDDQLFESWLWDDLFLEWSGSNFTVTPGRAYEMVTIRDTFVLLVGSNDPAGAVSLNENPATTDKNWVSIPYNAAYATISDITDEYSPSGDPLIKATNLRDDQYFESWLWDDLFLEWSGTNFAITAGRGYEMVTVSDTTWNPTEYTNQAKAATLAHIEADNARANMRLGSDCEPARTPAWYMANGEWQIAKSQEPRAKNQDEIVDGESINANQYSERSTRYATRHTPRTASRVERQAVSHIVRVYVAVDEHDDVIFTAYRPDQPYDVLTEQLVGSGIAQKDDVVAVWFDVGNFQQPWQDGERIIVIIEAEQKGNGYCTVIGCQLDGQVDIQELGYHDLVPTTQEQEYVIGYSLYKSGERVNDDILTDCIVAEDVCVRAVIQGGYETVYGSSNAQAERGELPVSYACGIVPNPFGSETSISYSIPEQTTVNLVVYDVTGREVVQLVSGVHAAGYYTVGWHGDDTNGRRVASGIYFVKMVADDFAMQYKVLLVR